ncbi:MAG: glycosyltransferase [Verrucomicrobiota bacterium]
MICTHATASITTRGGGIPEALRQLVCAQTAAGLTAKVVGFADQGTDLTGWPPGSLQRLMPTRLPGFPWAFGFAQALGATGPCVLHTHGLWLQPSVVVPKVAELRQIPWIVSPHGMLDPWALSNSRWKKRLAAGVFENRHLHGAACLHALCQSEGDAMRAYKLSNPIAIIPNGVNLPEERSQESESRGRSSARRILLFLGRLHPKKGLPNALRAWAEVSKQRAGDRGREDWQFVVAGWDQEGHESELQKLCSEIGLDYAEVSVSEFLENEQTLHTDGPAVPPQPSSDGRRRTADNGTSVLFVGPAFGSEKEALFRRASAFILPSFSEGLPMSVLEAWSYRLPVLMTAHCNLPEGFAHNAAFCIGTDVQTIVEGMRFLLQSPPPDLKSLGDNGWQLVSERFTWAKVASQMMEVYKWMLGEGPTPGCVEKFR